jgi:LPS sulfotransferase NodH
MGDVMAVPAVTYIIASTMRTGSYLLCEGLEATGRGGHPREIFCPERRSRYTGEWLLRDNISFDVFLQTAIEKGTTENGVFGTKIHAHHVEPLARQVGFRNQPWQVLLRLFPDAKYVHLRREDRRAQAISWYRAEVTNQWWLIPGESDWDLTGREPVYHGPEIRRLELELARHQAGWDAFFALNPVEVLAMEYETLAADYRGEVARALAFIGEDAELAKALPEPRLVRQGDATTEEWRRRMDAEFPR